MLNYVDFTESILIIKEYYDKDRELTKILNTEGFVNFSSNIIEQLILLLEKLMDDEEDQWIQYWLWELDFGKDWKVGKVTTTKGTDVRLKTTKDLYEALVRGN